LVENVYVNCLSAEGKPFANFMVIARPAVIAMPVKENIKRMYEIFTQLSSKGIADADFRRNTVYIKGNDQEVADQLNRSKAAFVSDKRDIIKLEVSGDLNVIRTLFYRALSRYAEKKGFRSLESKRRGKQRRLLPLGLNLDFLMEQGLAIRMNEDLIVYRGLYVLLEVFDSGKAVLWVDLYSPIVKLPEQRPLSPREAKLLGLKDAYTSYIPTPIERLELTNKLLKLLCSNHKLNVIFADGDTISFTCTFSMLRVIKEV